jgi:hypothetical protein
MRGDVTTSENITPNTSWHILQETDDASNIINIKITKASETLEGNDIVSMLEATMFTEVQFRNGIDTLKSIRIISSNPKVHVLLNPSSRKIEAIRLLDA